MANNYTPNYNQYLTQTAGYALPSNVRTYSVFDHSSNSWKRMTNDGRSPMPASPAQQQADIAGALAQARQTQGTVYPAQGMTPTQTPGVFLRARDQGQIPAQTPLGGPRMASNGQQRGGMGDSPSQPSASPREVSMSPADAVAFGAAMQNPGASLQAQPRVFMPLESRYENFQTEIPRSNLYGPLQNPRTVRSMSPDYQEASAAPVAVAQPASTTPVNTKTIPMVTAPTTQPTTPVAVPLATSHKPTVSVYDAINQEHNNIPLRVQQVTPSGAMAAFRSGLTRSAVPYLRDGLLGLLGRTEPLAKATRAAQAGATRSRLTPDAQRIADFLKR